MDHGALSRLTAHAGPMALRRQAAPTGPTAPRCVTQRRPTALTAPMCAAPWGQMAQGSVAPWGRKRRAALLALRDPKWCPLALPALTVPTDPPGQAPTAPRALHALVPTALTRRTGLWGPMPPLGPWDHVGR